MNNHKPDLPVQCDSPTNQHSRHLHRFRWLWPLSGLAALIWFLIRVIPKPSRAAYPCQRAAFPLAAAFVTWCVGTVGSIVLLRKARQSIRQHSYVTGVLAAGLGLIVMVMAPLSQSGFALADCSYANANNPIGVAKSRYPGRVVWVHEPDVTDWAYPSTGSGAWFDHVNQSEITQMLDSGLRQYTGAATPAAAWDAIFHAFNLQYGRGDVGYTSGQKIFIKINLVTALSSNNCQTNYTQIDCSSVPVNSAIADSPQLVIALLNQLVNVAGVAQSDITIGDPSGVYVNQLYTPVHTVFPDVHYLDRWGEYNRTRAQAGTTPLYWSTASANGTTQDYLVSAESDAAYLINMPVLKSHSRAGVTVAAKNYYGSLWRLPTGNIPGGTNTLTGTDTYNGYYNMHTMLASASGNTLGLYSPLVDLMGHRQLGGKAMLYLVDGTYGGDDWNSAPSKWSLAPFSNDWPSSIFIGMDPVAVDSVALDFVSQQWPSRACMNQGVENFLHEAALANNPPSTTVYDPERDGTRMSSLGVHEHWNNLTNKKYSRNLGTGDGIELIYLNPDNPLSPMLLAPAYRSATNNTRPAFDWGDVGGASQYQLQVDDSSDFSGTLEINQTLTASTYTPGTALANGVHYWRVRAGNGILWSDYSSTWTVTIGAVTPTTPPPTTPPVTTPPVTTPPPGTVSINAGGQATGSFTADQYFSGGSTYTNTATITMSQIPTNPPPAAIFNTERYGTFTYTIPNRSGAQTVTLYFAETYVTAAGQRVFNVSINGAAVLSNFDIFDSAGGQNRAIARTFSTTANASGQVVIQFTAVTQSPKVNGITVAGGSPTPTTPPPTTPPATTPPVTTPPPGTVSINSGGPATGSFTADQYFSGGSTSTNTATINMSQIPTNPPPAAIFNTERSGTFTYTIPNRSGAQTVTLYFAETSMAGARRRIFNVSINNTTVLSNFDIYTSAGGQNRAIARTFNATANASGQVVIRFTAVTQSPKVNGITVAGGSPTPTTPPPTTPPPTTPPATTPPATTPPPGTVSINAGGQATGSFTADQYFSGGSTYTNTATINMSQIPTNPPPAAIFNTERYGTFTYTIPNRSGAQTVTLYFAETYVTAAGQRVFNVSINGVTVLSNFDIFDSAGGQNRAIARTFSTTANASGQVVIQFTAVTQNPKISGITVASGG